MMSYPFPFAHYTGSAGTIYRKRRDPLRISDLIPSAIPCELPSAGQNRSDDERNHRPSEEDHPVIEPPRLKTRTSISAVNLAARRDFYSTSLVARLDARSTQSAAARALRLFHSAALEAPAYSRFLAAHGLDPQSVRTIADFHHIPFITKENYLRVNLLPSMCINGELERCEMIAVSSGSTGTPMFWPRSLSHELEIATRFEQLFRDSFASHEQSTLAVVCFTMGTWVGGIFTTFCCRLLAQKGYPITTVTPGTNRAEIFRCVEELGPLFDQVVLLGYPPFLKDVIDSGIARGVDWSPRRIKLALAGEVFSEEWRDLVGSRTSSTRPCFDSASLYGTADAGVLGVETPVSVGIRRFLARSPEAARQLFGESRLPTLVQYDPNSRYFEAEDGALAFTGETGIPLIRYRIGDTGGVVAWDEMLEFLRDHRFNPVEELAGAVSVHRLPFVYVFGRSDFTVSFFGANVYPENITVGLEQTPIPEWTTGKFVLEVSQDPEHTPRLSVAVELLPGVEPEPDMERLIADSIRRELLRLNSEFAHYVPTDRQSPLIQLCASGDPSLFPPGVKHRYTRRRTGPDIS
jgi:phenylacetate-CoA ligase